MKEGTRVRALIQIVDSDTEPDPNAESCEPGWVYADAGDEGEVVHVEEQYTVIDPDTGILSYEDGPAVTVYFEKSETNTLVMPNEIEII